VGRSSTSARSSHRRSDYRASQERFAGVMGVHKRTLTKYLAGTLTPSPVSASARCVCRHLLRRQHAHTTCYRPTHWHQSTAYLIVRGGGWPAQPVGWPCHRRGHDPESSSVNGGHRETRSADVDRMRLLVSRTVTIATMPILSTTVTETAAMVTTVAFWTNTRQPRPLIVTNWEALYTFACIKQTVATRFSAATTVRRRKSRAVALTGPGRPSSTRCRLRRPSGSRKLNTMRLLDLFKH
jgi:hypothetical protein